MRCFEISEICLISLYVSFTNVKGNQANLRNLKKSPTNFKIGFSKFFQLFDFFGFQKMFDEKLGKFPLSSLERRDYCFNRGKVAGLCQDYFPPLRVSFIRYPVRFSVPLTMCEMGADARQRVKPGHI